MDELENEDGGAQNGNSSVLSSNAANQEFTRVATYKDILAEIDAFLSKQRFSNDVCIILNMPESMLKKHKEKLNAAIWYVYNKYCNGTTLTMFDVLMAIESMIDSVKLSAMLDNDVKLCVANERSIKISEEELEYVVSLKGKFVDDEDLSSKPMDTDDGEQSDIDPDDAAIMEGLV